MLMTLKKSENSDEMPQNEASSSGYTLFAIKDIKDIQRKNIYLGMITCDPLMFTMDLPKFIVSNQKEKSICV